MLYVNNTRPACPNCSLAIHVRKHGKARSGISRYLCCECRLTFQTKYIYFACQRSLSDVSAT